MSLNSTSAKLMAFSGTVNNKNYPNSTIAKINICKGMLSMFLDVIFPAVITVQKYMKFSLKIQKLTFLCANFSFGFILILY